MNKRQLRSQFLKIRRDLPVDQWRAASDRLCQHLQTSPYVQQAQTILAYFSIHQEPDLSSLFFLPKVWGFPRCVHESLTWHAWSPYDPLPLFSGAYGIPEPHPDSPKLDVATIDLILVPAVACDRRGYRLGYGGGFYDRLLGDPVWASKPTIGITFAFAQVETLPIDPWDHPLTALCTDAGFTMLSPLP